MTENAADHENNLIKINLVDYGRTRDEIDKRTALSAQLLNFQIVLVAAVCSGFEKLPKEILLVVSCLSSVLWLMWIDHTSQIYKLAAYNEIVIARKLRTTYAGVLGWEAYMRRLELDYEVCAALNLDPSRTNCKLLRTEHIGRYIMLLFLGSAVALSGYYIWYVQNNTGCKAPPIFLRVSWCLNWEQSAGVALAALLLAYAWFCSRRLSKTTAIIGEAMRAPRCPAASTP